MSAPPPETARAGRAADHVADLVARHFGARGGELLVGGIAVGELAARHDTPVFVYDAGTLTRQWRALRAALPDRFEIFYSVKANPNQHVLRCFLERGCGLEVASSGELCQALAAGCPAERIFFAGPGKTEAELATALDREVGEIHVESRVEARRLAELARRRRRPSRVALRVNLCASVEGGGLRMGARPAPFGIDEDQLDATVDAIGAEPWLDVVGLHLYLGTQVLDAGVLVAQYGAALETARRLAKRLGRPLSTIDLGGGLGVPYFEHERRLDLDRLRRGAARLAEEAAADPALASARLVLEPGRFLVAEAGIYVARVTDVKVSRGRTFVVTDGGMHQHLAASGNLGQTIRRNFPVAVVNKLDQPGGEAVDVVGPLCTPLDVLARGIRLPPVAIGDLIGVFQSGAYARAASPLGFLSRPSPPEVMVAQGRDRLVRRRGRDEDHLADQVAPRDGAPGRELDGIGPCPR
jgi:diaminopimelate decarboxylase